MKPSTFIKIIALVILILILIFLVENIQGQNCCSTPQPTKTLTPTATQLVGTPTVIVSTPTVMPTRTPVLPQVVDVYYIPIVTACEEPYWPCPCDPDLFPWCEE